MNKWKKDAGSQSKMAHPRMKRMGFFRDDFFDAKIEKLKSEQGPGMGAAMLAAYGCSWFLSLKECAQVFIQTSKTYYPIPKNVEAYKNLFEIYKKVQVQTKELNEQLRKYRR
ncbi:hypothetical protein [Neobacillus sp. Marseille-QA0830]